MDVDADTNADDLGTGELKSALQLMTEMGYARLGNSKFLLQYQ